MFFAKDADVIALFTIREKPKPCKLQYINEDGESCVLIIEKILAMRIKERSGEKIYVYDCFSWRGCEQLYYELLFSPSAGRWVIRCRDLVI